MKIEWRVYSEKGKEKIKKGGRKRRKEMGLRNWKVKELMKKGSWKRSKEDVIESKERRKRKKIDTLEGKGENEKNNEKLGKGWEMNERKAHWNRKNKLKKENNCCFYLFNLFLRKKFSPIK